MKVLITGGSGLIGRELTQNLTNDDHKVVILSRSPERVTGLPQGARAIKWNAKTAEGWGAEVDGADVIVNLAGASLAGDNFLPTRWTAERRQLLHNSRITDVGKAVTEAVEQATNKPGVVIQSSAIGYYGPRTDEIVTEESSPADDFLASLCVDWEAATAAVEDFGVRRVIIRSGIVLTTKSGALPRMLLPFKLFAGGPFGNGQQWYSWIHMYDEIAAIRFLIEHQNASGIFNLTGPNPMKNNDFAKVLGKVMKRPSFMPIPGFAMRMMFGEVATVVLDGQHVVPKRLQEMGFLFKFPELEDALRDLLK